MSAAPIVSVVMAAYNGAALIEETLASLAVQTMPEFEAIVVDDCSKDETREVVARWHDARVRLVPLAENGGPVRARNHALSHARGRYIAALDQDDLCHPERFARQVAYLDAHTEVGVVGTAATVLFEDGSTRPSRHAKHTTPALVGWMLKFANPLVWSSVMVRGDVARGFDPFTRPEILYAEDFDLYQRVARVAQVARIDEPLITYRSHSGGASQRYETTMIASALRVLTEANADAFGAEAPRVAGLFVRHLMHGRPVPDVATLVALGEALLQARDDYVARTGPSTDDRALIDGELRRVWEGAVRCALRAGTIGVRDALAASPAGAAGRIDRLAWNSLVGRVRRARGGDQTLAA